MMIPGRGIGKKISGISTNLADYASGSFEVIKESYSVIFVTIITSILAGIFLGKSTDFLKMVPGLIVLIPGAVDMRGDIFSSLGSRLGSEFHLGLIEKFDTKNKFVRDNISASITLTFLLSILLGVFAKLLCSMFGLESIDIYSFILISLIGGMVSGVILLILTFFISFTAFARGWDPDNVTAPLITTMGDFFTIPSLLFATYIVIPLHEYAKGIVLISLLIAVLNFALVLRRDKDFKRLIFYSAIAIFSSNLLSTSSGIFMQFNIEKLILFPSILLMVPAFLEEGSNICNVLASRVSTKLHLGLIKPKLTIDETVRREIFNSFVLFLLVFPVIGVFTHIACILTGISSLGLFKTVVISTFAGFLLNTIVIAITFIMSVLSFRKGVDPDNIIIPIITSIADLLGVLCLFMVLSLAT